MQCRLPTHGESSNVFLIGVFTSKKKAIECANTCQSDVEVFKIRLNAKSDFGNNAPETIY